MTSCISAPPKTRLSATKLIVDFTLHTAANGGKPWKFLLIPHDLIAENMTLASLAGHA
ncbi:MAG TPA: hypothetical protein VEM38_03205 [Burkholderiales bacterium]|nr:hypothetical protein [Burkholderiales bacterium]